ncbi:MAG TPA: DUF2784 domain-containing protein [Candidatus Polarisedimenticolaceae bacterium]|nr:DUF2784 domain-containing protein [Candidatus Polarisedimenticolaceae bacterium]
MGYRLLADAVALLHLTFILFIPLGGLAVVRWPRLAWLHLGCALWGAVIVFTDVVCPLTPLEKALRLRAGEPAYEGGFIRHYLVGPLFRDGLPPALGWTLLAAALVGNGWLYRRAVRHRRELRSSP